MAVGYQTLKGAVDSPEQPLLHFLVCSNSVIFEVTTVFTDVAFSSVILEVDLLFQRSLQLKLSTVGSFSNALCYILTTMGKALITDSKLDFTTCKLFQGHD